MNAGQESLGQLLVACGDAAKVFEFVEEPLDAIALVLDDGTLLLNHPQGQNLWGLHLARIREVLRWSAPV